MNIGKMTNERLSQVLIFTLFGAAAVIILVLLPMGHHLRGLNDQERLLIKDTDLINGLRKIRNGSRPNPRLIAFNDASMVMEEISALGNTHSITFLSMASQEKNKSSYKKINTLPVDLETQSTYKQLGLFMGELNNLRRGIVLIDSFQIVGDTQEPGKVKSKMRVHICLKSEGHGKK